jgi:hypothetical protein
MRPVTSTVEVIEEVLGENLAASDRLFAQLEKLSENDLKRLSWELYGHSEAMYLLPPHADQGEVVCLHHPQGQMTRSLGGVGWGPGQMLTATAEELMGALYFSLAYYPRVAIKDGLEYHLDFCRLDLELVEQARRAIIEMLKFYAYARELIRQNQFIIIPRTVWSDIRTQGSAVSARQGLKVLEEIVPGLSQTTLVVEHEYTTYLRDNPRHLADVAESYAGIPARQVPARACADLLGGTELGRLYDLVIASELCGFSPILDTALLQLVFDEVRRLGYLTLPTPARALDFESAAIMLPRLGRLGVREFLRARDTDAFSEFRQTLDEIGVSARGIRERPVDLRAMVDEKLKAAEERVQRRIRSTGSPVTAEFAGLSVAGGVAGALLGMTIPEFATAGIFTASNVLARYLAMRKKKKDLQSVRNIFVKMRAPA